MEYGFKDKYNGFKDKNSSFFKAHIGENFLKKNMNFLN